MHVCITQSFASLGAIPLMNDKFRGQHLRLPGVRDVSCSGSELHFSECSYNYSVGDCDSAAVICQGQCIYSYVSVFICKTTKFHQIL